MIFSLLVFLLFPLLAVVGADGGLQTLAHRGRQERGICSAEGKCLNRVVTCPAECPETKPSRKSQGQACAVDCTAACAATCKTFAYKPKPYQTWCNKTNNEKLCEYVVQSDPRYKLKTSPQGLVVILVSAAQAKANATRTFIYKVLKNQSNNSDNSKDVIEGCFLAYSLVWVRSSLSVDIERVRNQKRCSILNDSLRDLIGEVTYDCEWDLPNPMPLTLNEMYGNVESLASIVDIARQILSLIGCGSM